MNRPDCLACCLSLCRDRWAFLSFGFDRIEGILTRAVSKCMRRHMHACIAGPLPRIVTKCGLTCAVAFALQIVAAADPPQVKLWLGCANDADVAIVEEGAGNSLTAAQFVATCSSWWRPRKPQLGPGHESPEFEVRVSWIGTCKQQWRMGQPCLLPRTHS